MVRFGRFVAVSVVVVLLGWWSASAWAATVVNHPDFSDTSDLTLNGPAIATGANVLQLTDAGHQASSVFTNLKVVNPRKPFHSHFTFNFPTGNTADAPADGLTFTVQNDPAGASALGQEGGSFGYAEDVNAPAPGITRSVAVAFNLNYGGEEHRYVEILKNGSATYLVRSEFDVCDCSPTAPVTYTGNTRYVWVDYSPKTHFLKVFISTDATKPSTPLVKKKINLLRVLGGRGYAGFTGGTGGSYVTADVKSWTLSHP